MNEEDFIPSTPEAAEAAAEVVAADQAPDNETEPANGNEPSSDPSHQSTEATIAGQPDNAASSAPQENETPGATPPAQAATPPAQPTSDLGTGDVPPLAANASTSQQADHTKVAPPEAATAVVEGNRNTFLGG